MSNLASLKQNIIRALLKYKVLQRVKPSIIKIIIVTKERVKSIIYIFKTIIKKRKTWIKILLIQILVSSVPSVAFAAGSPELPNEAKLGGALAAAGVVTVTTFVIGIRYLILGNSVSTITDSAVSSVDRIFERFDQLIKKYIGESNPSGSSSTSNAAPVNEITRGQIELTADRILDKLGKTMDERVDRLNPITYAQNTTDKMASFIKKVLNNTRTDRTHEWLANLEHKVDGLEQDNKVRLQSAIQKLMKDLEKQGGNLDEAFKDIDPAELENMADYVCVTASRSSGTGEMASIMEPFCLQYPSVFIILTLLVLKLAPFYLYIGIKLKRSFLFNN